MEWGRVLRAVSRGTRDNFNTLLLLCLRRSETKRKERGREGEGGKRSVWSMS